MTIDKEALEILRRLVKTANLLLQNSTGCATSHYGDDFALHGLPGFLRDAESDIIAGQGVVEALASTTPETGRKLAPADPTDAMVDAALAVDWECDGDERAVAINVWYAMYAAARQPVDGEPVGYLEANYRRRLTSGRIATLYAERAQPSDVAVFLAPPAGTAPVEVETFQSRVHPWMIACFGEEISRDRIERNHRFLEEALELVQATGCTQSEAHQLVDYVFGREIGEPKQEAGGALVTLAALCLANDFDMHAAGETELARIWTKVDKIRAKQAAKPKHSPLLAHPPAGTAPVEVEVSIKPMKLSGGRCDYFVSFRCGDREVTPHSFREQFKAEYHVALYRWLLGQGAEPDGLEFNEGDWPARKYTAEEQRAFAALSAAPAVEGK